jgi:hypothetical protein
VHATALLQHAIYGVLIQHSFVMDDLAKFIPIVRVSFGFWLEGLGPISFEGEMGKKIEVFLLIKMAMVEEEEEGK